MAWSNIGLQLNMKVITMDKDIRDMLQTSVTLIDMGAERGAWKGPELVGVGQLRLAITARLEQDDNDVKGEVDNGESKE